MKDNRFIAAVDLGGTFIKSALIRADGEVLKKAKTPTRAEEDQDTVIVQLLRAIEEIYVPEVIGIGIGSPGCVNPHSGEVNWIQNIPALNGVNLRSAVQRKFEITVHIDNDATNAARGQYLYGAGKQAVAMLGITLGTGVGGGLVLNGKVYRGVINYAGEIGHITYIPDGMVCTCGKRGCLEAYASATAIVRSAESMLTRRIPSQLKEIPPQELTARLVCDLARTGDEVCQSIVQDAGKALGVVIGGAINLLNLDRVIIGGGLAAAGDVLFDEIRLYASRHSLPLAFERCEILPDHLGNDAGIMGSAAMVLMEEANP